MAEIDWGLSDPSQQPEEKPQQPPATNPLIDFFNASLGGTVRGFQQSAANIGTTLSTLTGNQGIQDWANRTSQDVQKSTPQFNPFLKGVNDVAESIGGMVGPIAAGAVAAGAMPEALAGAGAAEIASVTAGKQAAMAVGSALGFTPIQFGSAKTEAISRGADQATADRIGMESAAGGAILFGFPMHQILAGGEITTRILKQAALNAGFGGALSYGQEEIMKANDVRPLPDGQEFNNTLYSTLIGGVTGTIFGALSPDEMAGKAQGLVDNHLAPAARAQLAAEYVKQGMTQEQADAKSIEDIEGKRPAMLRDTQAMLIKQRISRSKLLDGNYDIINKDKTPEPIKLFSVDRKQGGLETEIPLTVFDMDKDTTYEASRIINTALATVKMDKKGNAVVDPLTQRPIIERTMVDDLPMIVRVALLNDVGQRIEEAKRQGTEDYFTPLVRQIKERQLPSMDKNTVYYVGASHGEPSDTQNSLFHMSIGSLTLHELAAQAHLSGGKIDPENFTIVHAGDAQGAHGSWQMLMDTYGKIKEEKERIQREIPQPDVYDQAAATEPTTTPQTEGIHEEQPQEQQHFDYNVPAQPEEPAPVAEEQKETPEEKANREQLERLEHLQNLKQSIIEDAKKTTQEYKSLPTSDNDGIFHSMLEDAQGSVGETTPEDLEGQAERPAYTSESKAKELLNSGEKISAVMGDPLQRNFLNTISDFVRQLHNLLGSSPSLEKPEEPFELYKEPKEPPNLPIVAKKIKDIQAELKLRKLINEHQHGQPLSEKVAPTTTAHLANFKSEDLMKQLNTLTKQRDELQKQHEEAIHGAMPINNEMIEDIQKNIQTAHPELVSSLKELFDKQLLEQRQKLEEAIDPQTNRSLWDDLESEFGPGVLDDPTGMKMLEVMKQRSDEGRPGEDNDYQKQVIKETSEGKPIKQLDIKTFIKVNGTDAKTGAELKGVELDGKFILKIEGKTIELSDGHHIVIPMKDWHDIQSKKQDAINAGNPSPYEITSIEPVQDVGVAKLDQLKPSGLVKISEEPIAMAATTWEKQIYNSIINMHGWKDIKSDDFGEVKSFIEANTKGIKDEHATALAKEMVRMDSEKPSILAADAVAKLTQFPGESLNIEELDPANVRSLPLKVAFKVAMAFRQKDQFIQWAQSHYGAEFPQKFQVKPPADVAHSIVEGLFQDRRTQELFRLIATENLEAASRQTLGISNDIAKGLVQKGLIKDLSRSNRQKVYKQLSRLISLSAEEVLPDGRPSFLGKAQAWHMSPDESIKNHTISDMMEMAQFFGLPQPDVTHRPEQVFTNMLRAVAQDRGEKVMTWVKRELEEPSFQAMIKAGVFDQTGIMANVAFGYSPRIFDKKGQQKLKELGGGIGGKSPQNKVSNPQRDAYNYSDFYHRSIEQGLDVVPGYIESMHDYITTSLGKAQQYNAINWLRMYRIPDVKNLKLPKESPEIRNTINNLNYIEYERSPNIVALAKLTGMEPNDILMHLGYFNKKDAEGLVGWDKYQFEKPYMQASIGDMLDWIYPHGAQQSEATSKIVGFANIPKWMMVTLDPLQHAFLFSTAVLANAGPRLPMVLGRFALTAIKTLVNAPFAAVATVRGEPQSHFPWGGKIEPSFENQANIGKFLPYGYPGWAGMTEGLFQDQKITRYIIPELMTGRQGWDAAVFSTFQSTKIVFGHWLSQELYNVTNERYLQFARMVDNKGNKLMTDEEAARRATTLINSTSGTIHASTFGPNGPAWSLMTFARGLTISPLRVISGIAEPTLRKIYGNTNKFKIDPFHGAINPISMGELSAKDADFLQFYFAQHLAKVLALRALAAGVVQYAMSFQDDDKKDEFGQQGHDPLNKKRFIYNNPEGMRLGIRTPWTDINGRRIMLNPTPFREGEQLLQMSGIESKYKLPESTMRWMANRLNVWPGLIMGAVNGVDMGTGQEIPGKGTDEYTDELTKWMLAKVVPLSLGVTQEEKEQRAVEPGAEAANRIGAFFGTTPSVAPKGWQPGYEEAQRIEKEHQEIVFREKEAARTMTKQEVLSSQLLKDLSAKQRRDIANAKDPGYNMRKVFKVMTEADRQREKEEQEALMQTTNTGE